ncbi:MAG: AAA family ATPase [Thermoguttaceae bacterium]
MIIEFKVILYRSFCEEQTLSLVASNLEKDSLKDNCIDIKLPGMSDLLFLKSVALYGANASGKSNLLRAIVEIASFVSRSFTENINLPTFAYPFMLREETVDQPSTFELTFVASGVRYLYSIALTQERVIKEALVAYPNGIPQRWYYRTWDETQKQYLWKFTSSFKKGRQISEKTRQNTTFISVGAQFNHPQLKPVYDWFASMVVVRANYNLTPFNTADYIYKYNKEHSRIVDYLKFADTGIVDYRIEKKNIPYNELPLEVQKSCNNKQQVVERINLIFFHKGENESIPFTEDQVSDGTKKYFDILGSWLDVLKRGAILIVDEIDCSLHSILVRKLLQLFHDKENNPNNAQIIFTSHDAYLLAGDTLRRDQIWFTSKNSRGETTLYPLTDYSPRKNEALMKGYLDGRYGAIPFLDQEFLEGTNRK